MPALDYNSTTYASVIAVITDKYHHTWFVYWDGSLISVSYLFFCPGWLPLNCHPPDCHLLNTWNSRHVPPCLAGFSRSSFFSIHYFEIWYYPYILTQPLGTSPTSGHSQALCSQSCSQNGAGIISSSTLLILQVFLDALVRVPTFV
jgi:hypothetical protein